MQAICNRPHTHMMSMVMVDHLDLSVLPGYHNSVSQKYPPEEHNHSHMNTQMVMLDHLDHLDLTVPIRNPEKHNHLSIHTILIRV